MRWWEIKKRWKFGSELISLIEMVETTDGGLRSRARTKGWNVEEFEK